MSIRDFFPIRVRGLERWFSSKPQRTRERIYDITSWLVHILAAVALVIFLLNYVILNCIVPTGSMIGTVNINDRVVGLRMAYDYSEPQRGDIVMFYAPDDLAAGTETIYIKRVIGLPGESVNITAGIVTVTTADGESITLNEDYLGSIDDGSYGTFQVPEGNYFMMGDNRANSFDSRKWVHSYVPIECVLAKAVVKIGKGGITFFEGVSYGE